MSNRLTRRPADTLVERGAGALFHATEGWPYPRPMNEHEQAEAVIAGVQDMIEQQVLDRIAEMGKGDESVEEAIQEYRHHYGQERSWALGKQHEGKRARVRYASSGLTESCTIERVYEDTVRIHFRNERRERGYATIADNTMSLEVTHGEIIEVDL